MRPAPGRAARDRRRYGWRGTRVRSTISGRWSDPGPVPRWRDRCSQPCPGQHVIDPYPNPAIAACVIPNPNPTRENASVRSPQLSWKMRLSTGVLKSPITSVGSVPAFTQRRASRDSMVRSAVLPRARSIWNPPSRIGRGARPGGPGAGGRTARRDLQRQPGDGPRRLERGRGARHDLLPGRARGPPGRRRRRDPGTMATWPGCATACRPCRPSIARERAVTQNSAMSSEPADRPGAPAPASAAATGPSSSSSLSTSGCARSCASIFLYNQALFHHQSPSHWGSRAAVDSLLDILSITTRADTRADVLKELERQVSLLNEFQSMDESVSRQ